MKTFFTFVCLLITLSACRHTSTVQKLPHDISADDIMVVAELDKGPGNITVTPEGEIIVSLHQFYNHEVRVASVQKGYQLKPFADGAYLNSVLGLQSDGEGTVWLLDNGMRGGTQRRLVGWDTEKDLLLADIDLTSVTNDQSFLNDLAVDSANNTVYIADPAGGANAAIIIVDVEQSIARRVLEGHKSVIPEDIDLVIDGNPVRIKSGDGTMVRPRVGINPIAIDGDGRWLYYGPMHGKMMYRIRTADLRNVNLSPKDLVMRSEPWAEKPICDGISIDNAGNLYLGDLGKNGIGVIGPDRKYRVLVSDPKLSWIDAFSFGPDGYLYIVANQLHRSAVLNGGKSIVQPPFLILKFKPFSGGMTGR